MNNSQLGPLLRKRTSKWMESEGVVSYQSFYMEHTDDLDTVRRVIEAIRPYLAKDVQVETWSHPPSQCDRLVLLKAGTALSDEQYDILDSIESITDDFTEADTLAAAVVLGFVKVDEIDKITNQNPNINVVWRKAFEASMLTELGKIGAAGDPAWTPPDRTFGIIE